MYEELQLIIKAINNAIERFEDDSSRFAYDGSHMLSRLKASLDDPSDAIKLYNDSAEQSPEKAHRPYVWDFEVYYRSEIVQFRYLIKTLEKIWNEHLMQLDGGA